MEKNMKKNACIGITESLCCTAENNTTLQVNNSNKVSLYPLFPSPLAFISPACQSKLFKRLWFLSSWAGLWSSKVSCLQGASGAPSLLFATSPLAPPGQDALCTLLSPTPGILPRLVLTRDTPFSSVSQWLLWLPFNNFQTVVVLSSNLQMNNHSFNPDI